MAGHAGDHETVAAGLLDDAPDARRVALGAAERLGMLTATSLLPHLSDPDPGVRHRAVEVAARLDDGHLLVDELIAFLAADGAEHRADEASAEAERDLAEVAAFAIGELDLETAARRRAATALGAQATGHHDALCRESAVAALGALGDGLEAILAATGDVATVRRRAVLALAPFEGPEVDRAIRAALDDRDWQVRQAAEDLIGPTPAGSDMDTDTDTDTGP